MRPRGSAKSLERRRRQAIKLLDSGLSMNQVAERLETSVASVFRRQQAATVGGAASLAAKPVPGRPAKLSEAECRRLLTLLAKGAKAYGHPTDRWTLKRVARLIQQEFGVEYHPNHVWRLLRRASWPGRVPEPRLKRSEKPA